VPKDFEKRPPLEWKPGRELTTKLPTRSRAQ
jgi:hypothetical protein